MRTKELINLSGSGYSGSTALRDLLLEFEHIHHFNPNKVKYPEYYFISDPGGLLDLYGQLDNNWSHLRSTYFLRKNRVLFNKLSAANMKFINPYGMNLKEFCVENPILIYNDFINQITLFSYQLDSRINRIDLTYFQLLFQKIIRTVKITDRVLNPDKNNFLNAIKRFHSRIFHSQNQKGYLLIEKAIPLSNIESGSLMFDSIYNLICLRHPGDTYVEMTERKTGIFKGSKHFDQNTLSNFLQWQENIIRPIYELSQNTNSINTKFLVVTFENLIQDYHRTVDRIREFFQNKLGQHRKYQTHFKPSLSKQNIEIFQNVLDAKEISVIENSEVYKMYKHFQEQ